MSQKVESVTEEKGGLLYDAAEALYQQDPTSRIVGSLGRGAIMGEVIPDIRPNGVPRNINAIHTSIGNADRYGSGELDVIGVELSTRLDKWIRVESNGTWLVFPADESIHVPLQEPEATLRAYPANVQNRTVHTLEPRVLAKVTRVMDITRPKDNISFARYEDYVQNLPPGINEELLEPFDEFREALREKRSYYIKAWLRNNLYHQLVPEEIRRRLKLSKHIPGVGVTPYVDKN